MSCCRSFARGSASGLPPSSAASPPWPSTRRRAVRTSPLLSRVRSSCPSWLMASGWRAATRGFRGQPSRSSAPGDRRAASRRWRRVPAGDVGRDTDRQGGAPVAPLGPWSVRLEVGAGLGGSGPAGDLLPDAGGARGRGGFDGHGTRVGGPGTRERVNAGRRNLQTRPGPAAAQAGVPGACPTGAVAPSTPKPVAQPRRLVPVPAAPGSG